jgi:hypothetical protein
VFSKFKHVKLKITKCRGTYPILIYKHSHQKMQERTKKSGWRRGRRTPTTTAKTTKTKKRASKWETNASSNQWNCGHTHETENEAAYHNHKTNGEAKRRVGVRVKGNERWGLPSKRFCCGVRVKFFWISRVQPGDAGMKDLFQWFSSKQHPWTRQQVLDDVYRLGYRRCDSEPGEGRRTNLDFSERPS